jgi:hypothetical protein
MLFPMEGYPLPIDLALIDYMKGCRILDSQARLRLSCLGIGLMRLCFRSMIDQ